MDMLKCTFDIVGLGPISFSRPIVSKKNTGELPDAFEERTWRERMHVDNDGMVIIPPTFLKNALSAAAKYLGESVPGKKGATYTKHFEAGIMVTETMHLGVKADDIECDRQYVPSDGVRGGTKRVWRNFPIISDWRCKASLLALDPVLMDRPAKILEYLEYTGNFIGFGRFRPRNNGYYGRFTIKNFKAEKLD